MLTFYSCENSISSSFESTVTTSVEAGAEALENAYIKFNIIEPGKNNSYNQSHGRSVSVVTASAFSDITFTGTKADGSMTITPYTADSFSALSQQTISVESGTWNFLLEAYLGKTATAPGEKYVAALNNQTIVPGTNELKMRLQADPASYATAAAAEAHPGSWQADLEFPAEAIDSIKIYLFKYSDYSQTSVNLTTLKNSSLKTWTLVKGTDFTANSVSVSENTRAMGNYVVYVEYCKNTSQQGENSVPEVLSSWGEFMRINPGIKTTVEITLENTDTVYTINYFILDDEGELVSVPWNTAASEEVPFFYSRKSGVSGEVTLPTSSAVTVPSGYTFEGWYTDADCTNGPLSEFNVTDATNKTFYAKLYNPSIYKIYISASPNGDDDLGNGTKAHPYATLRKALESFPNPTLTDDAGNFVNNVYVLSDYTITQGCNTGIKVYANIIGCKGGTTGVNVTFVCKTPADSALYIQNDQKIKMKNIDFCTLGYEGSSTLLTSTNFASPNVNASICVTTGTEFTLENSTLQYLVGKDCSVINIDGKCTLNNVTIKNNYTINSKPSGTPAWGCSVLVKQGELHVSGTTSISSGRLYSTVSSYTDDSCVWIGSSDGTPEGTFYNPIVVDSAFTGSISVTPYSYPSAGDTPITIAKGGSEYTGFSAAMSTLKTQFTNNDMYKIDSYSSAEGTVVALAYPVNSFYMEEYDFSHLLVNAEGKAEIQYKAKTGFGAEISSSNVSYFYTLYNYENSIIASIANTESVESNITGGGYKVEIPPETKRFVLGVRYKSGAKRFEATLEQDNLGFVTPGVFYVSGPDVTPAGASSASGGDGSITKPFNTLTAAIDAISNASDNTVNYVIVIRGTVTGNASITSTFAAASLTIKGDSAATSILDGGNNNTVLKMTSIKIPVTIKNLTIQNGNASTAGGGLVINGKSGESRIPVTIDGCVIKNNSATSIGGGGIYSSSNVLTTIVNTEISGNTSSNGGGIYVTAGSIVNLGDGCVIKNNTANSNGGGIYSKGDVYLYGTAMIGEDGTGYAQAGDGLHSNKASQGGGICVENTSSASASTALFFGKKYDSTTASAVDETLTGGVYWNYSSGMGGGIYITSDTTTYPARIEIDSGIINGNGAMTYGGAVCLASNSSLTMTGGEIRENYANTYGGAFYILSGASITFGKTGSTSIIHINDNTATDENNEDNICLSSNSIKINVAGPLNTTSEIGVNHKSGLSTDVFTDGYAANNSSITPAQIFTSDAGYIIVAGTGGEAAFVDASNSGSVYAPDAYVFSLIANRSTLTLGSAATVTITPTITRTEANGGTTELYYNAADQKLYLDSAFTQPEGSGGEVTWAASLWCGADVEYSSLAAGTESSSNAFTIPALSFENTYTMHVTATFQGQPHNANFTLQCEP